MGMAKLEKVIRNAMLDAANRYSVTGDPRVHEGFVAEVQEALVSIWKEAVKGSGREIIQQFKADCYTHIETKADEDVLFNRIVQEFIERYGARKIVAISKATEDQIRKLIARGMREGLGQQAIAKLIAEQTPVIAQIRSEVIARTETHGSSQFASQRVAEESRFPLEKVWNSVDDLRTRDFGEGDAVVDAFSHRVMNGVRVQLHQPFVVPIKTGGTEALMFPGDPNGSAGNVINCRCAQTYERAQ
jgi:hypothetical protein